VDALRVPAGRDEARTTEAGGIDDRHAAEPLVRDEEVPAVRGL
jgi:hypothetical protein